MNRTAALALALALVLVLGLAGLARAAAGHARRPPKIPRHLTRDSAQEVGTQVWMVHNGERGTVSAFGFSGTDSGVACFPFPDRPETGGCVEVTFRDGAKVWFGPDAEGLVYPELTRRPMGGAANTVPGLNALNRNMGDGADGCRDYIKMVLDPKRQGEALKYVAAARDRRCHNEYLGGAWNPSTGGKYAMPEGDAERYRERLVDLAAAAAGLSPGAEAHLRQHALLAYVDEFNGELAAEGGYEALPAFWGLFLVRPHDAATVRRVLARKDPVCRLTPPGAKGARAAGQETFTVYGAPGRSDRAFVRVGERYTATVIGGGLELARPHLPDVAPEHQEAVLELLGAVYKQGAAAAKGNRTLLPFNGEAGLLSGAAARYRAYHEKYEVARKLGKSYERALGTFARPLAALTLYASERTGRLLGEDRDTQPFRDMLARPFEQLVYVNEAESVEQVPVASYGCPKLAGPASCRPPVAPSAEACAWDAVLHLDANRWKRYESSDACTAKRFTGKGKCTTPDAEWFEMPVPRKLPKDLAYLEHFGYFEFDAKHDARTWAAATDRLKKLTVPGAVGKPAARAAYRLVYSLAAGLGSFLASDDGGLGAEMNVGLRGGAQWGNWNLRCTDRKAWAGRTDKSLECETGWETPVWNDLKTAVVLLDAVQRVAGVPCGGEGSAPGKDGAYVAGAAKALSTSLAGVLDGFFGLPLAAASLSSARPTEETKVLLFTVKNSREGGTPAALCPRTPAAARKDAPAAAEARFARRGMAPAASAAAYCADEEVSAVVAELAKLRGSPAKNEAMRGRVAGLRERFGAALRHIFRRYVGPDVEKAGYPELAALFKDLPDQAIIPDGGDKTEKDADKRDSEKEGRKNGVPGDKDDLSRGGAAAGGGKAGRGAAAGSGGGKTEKPVSEPPAHAGGKPEVVVVEAKEESASEEEEAGEESAESSGASAGGPTPVSPSGGESGAEESSEEGGSEESSEESSALGPFDPKQAHEVVPLTLNEAAA